MGDIIVWLQVLADYEFEAYTSHDRVSRDIASEVIKKIEGI